MDHNLIRTNIQKELTFRLTDQEMAALGKQAADMEKERKDLEIQLSDYKKEMREKINTLLTSIKKHLNKIRRGEESRLVEVAQEMNYSSGEVSYYYKGEHIDTRSMLPGEMQKPIQFEPRNLKTVPENELRDIIREETNFRTKHSSVDGPA